MIMALLILMGFIVVMLSPVSGLFLAGVLANKELVFTFLVLATFKLLNNKIETIVERTEERIRANASLLFMLLAGLLLWFAKDREWWGYQPPVLLMSVFSLLFMLFPVYFVFTTIRGAIRDEMEES